MVYKNIVFAGGGTKTIAHLGVIYKLKELNLLTNVESFVGNSIGSIFAFIMAIGIDIKTIYSKLHLDNIHQLYDILDLTTFFHYKVQYIFTHLSNFILDNGIFNSNNIKFSTWIQELLVEYNLPKNCSFLDLYKIKNKKLTIVGANINTKKPYYFNYINTPTLGIEKTLMISICYPYLYKPIPLLDTDFTNYIIPNNLPKYGWVDGGLYDNFPIYIMDHKYTIPETLGIYFITKNNDDFHKYINNKSRIISIELLEIHTFSPLKPNIIDSLLYKGYCSGHSFFSNTI